MIHLPFILKLNNTTSITVPECRITNPGCTDFQNPPIMSSTWVFIFGLRYSVSWHCLWLVEYYNLAITLSTSASRVRNNHVHNSSKLILKLPL